MGELSRLHMFKEVADKQSFVKAAEICGVSKAAISKQISLLEKKLGVQLLDRSTRHVSLTQLGQIYLNQIRELLVGLEEASLLVSQIHKAPSGRLRVTAARIFGERFIIPHLSKFLNKYPSIRLELELAERIPDIIHENIDISVGMSVSGSPNCIQKTIAKTKYILCASPLYLKEMGVPKTPDELIHHRYIAHSMRKPDNEIQFANGKHLYLNPYLRVNDAATMLDFAKKNLGIVLLHEYVVKEDLLKKNLIRILEKFEKPEIPLFLNYQAQRFLLPKIRCFIEFIDAICQEDL